MGNEAGRAKTNFEKVLRFNLCCGWLFLVFLFLLLFEEELGPSEAMKKRRTHDTKGYYSKPRFVVDDFSLYEPWVSAKSMDGWVDE